MYIISLVAMTLISISLGAFIGIVIRLKERNLPISMARYVINYIYYIIVNFRKSLREDKDLYIDALASAELEKGTVNKKEIINKRRQSILAVWDDKFIRELHHVFLLNIIKNNDHFIDNLFDSLTEFYVEHIKKNNNINNKLIFSDQKKEFTDSIKAVFVGTNICV